MSWTHSSDRSSIRSALFGSICHTMPFSLQFSLQSIPQFFFLFIGDISLPFHCLQDFSFLLFFASAPSSALYCIPSLSLCLSDHLQDHLPCLFSCALLCKKKYLAAFFDSLQKLFPTPPCPGPHPTTDVRHPNTAHPLGWVQVAVAEQILPSLALAVTSRKEAAACSAASPGCLHSCLSLFAPAKVSTSSTADCDTSSGELSLSRSLAALSPHLPA